MRPPLRSASKAACKPGLNRLQFIIDGYTQGLKCFRCRMNVAWMIPGGYCLGYDLCQIGGCVDIGLTGLDPGGDAARKTLFAIAVNRIGKLSWCRAAQSGFWHAAPRRHSFSYPKDPQDIY